MLSDCSGMTGGETALKTATGEIMKVRGPAMGTAVVMQGRYIEHQALKAFGGRERISMVNSFRAKLSLVRDVTVFTGVRSTSNLSELYTEYSEYRLKALEERVWARLEKERQRQLTRRPFNIDDMKCVIVATRPVLLSALMERLENLAHKREYWRAFLALTKTLISSGIKSAVKSLQILSNDDNLLEMFLPYDLEFTYAAALHLAMANALFPQILHGQVYSKEAHSILEEMIENGNKIAEVRQTELAQLEGLFEELAAREKSQGLQPLTLSSPTTPEMRPALEAWDSSSSMTPRILA
ncbi:hypothetical protein ETB97_007289 [Aspergillus alliaceus]|uniref:Uncharacterized protein n=1 Tax=Petromyces alliaceus TaxID=209559 RepID=A0A8H6E224_PETAA|nr:hypothetical protein ETB97_007289 [Aspergillus burnettii]